MSTNALSVINEAAVLIGDPLFSRITRSQWVALMNQSARDVAKKLRIVLKAATFDIVAGQHEYALPDDCWQVKSFQFNETPEDETTWWWLTEVFEDEYRKATNGMYPSSGRPTNYFVNLETFHLYQNPSESIVGGGKIRYWGMPSTVSNEAVDSIPLQDIMRDTLRDRMVTYALRILEKWDAASNHEREWNSSITIDRDRIEDRSADRRARIRTRPGNTFGQR